jgi:hypothetical protein
LEFTFVLDDMAEGFWEWNQLKVIEICFVLFWLGIEDKSL